MHITIIDDSVIPVHAYGGVERVIWWLGKELVKLGHKVTFIAGKGSYCPFADVLIFDEKKELNELIPQNTDVVHINFPVEGSLDIPYIITHHGNYWGYHKYDLNTVFVSKNHANRYNSECYVHIGLDFEEYGNVDFTLNREYFLFLGHVKKKIKNIDGCIKIAKSLNEKLGIIGGEGENKDKIEYFGFLGGKEKSKCINKAKALLFPVLWHEPFGIAIIEALYFGCPVFGTPYGSLSELIPKEFGFLSNNINEIIEAASDLEFYNRKKCNEYVRSCFSSEQMAKKYLNLYEKVINGENLNKTHPVCIPNLGNLLVFD